MKDYIKKFETAVSSDQYAINDIPFLTAIATDPVQALACNEEGKKLINRNGVVSVFPPYIELVNLGLSSGTLWAKHNVGANVETELGGLYAWGELSTKETYAWENYTFRTSGTTAEDVVLSKYNDTDNKTVLEDVDNVAKYIYDIDIPSYDDLIELENECTREWTTINGVAGIKYTGPNTNYIFFPGGLIYNGVIDTTKAGAISKTRFPESYYMYAYRLERWSEGSGGVGISPRNTGTPVRPVKHVS